MAIRRAGGPFCAPNCGFESSGQRDRRYRAGHLLMPTFRLGVKIAHRCFLSQKPHS